MKNDFTTNTVLDRESLLATINKLNEDFKNRPRFITDPSLPKNTIGFVADGEATLFKLDNQGFIIEALKLDKPKLEWKPL
jgi:hypothetical protein